MISGTVPLHRSATTAGKQGNPGAESGKAPKFPDAPALAGRRKAGALARTAAPSGMARKPEMRPAAAAASKPQRKAGVLGKESASVQEADREGRRVVALAEIRSIQVQAAAVGATAKERAGVAVLAKKHALFLLKGVGVELPPDSSGRQRTKALLATLAENESQQGSDRASVGAPAGQCP